MREIEIKIRTNNLNAIKQKLAERVCVRSEPISQHVQIYSRVGSTEEWENSKEGHVVMRIRRMPQGAEFNLKMQRSNEMDNLEYETKIDDPDAMHQILAILGYAPQVTVKKLRRKGKLADYEICLDEVEELGSFVELEKLTSDDANPEVVKKELLKVLELLGLSKNDEETRGYDTQIYYLHHANHNIKTQNF